MTPIPSSPIRSAFLALCASVCSQAVLAAPPAIETTLVDGDARDRDLFDAKRKMAVTAPPGGAVCLKFVPAKD